MITSPHPFCLEVIYFKYPCSLSLVVVAELDQKQQARDKEVDGENLTDGLTGRRIAAGSENSPPDASRFGAEVVPAPSLAARVYIYAWGRRMMNEGPVGGSQTLAPLIYPHVRLGEEGEDPRQSVTKTQYVFPLL